MPAIRHSPAGLLAGAALILAACDTPPTPSAATVAVAPLPAYDPATSLHSGFSGDRALAWAQAITAGGPRPSGSEALEKTRQYLEAELKTLGWITERQTFEDTTPRGRVGFVNLRARFPGPGDVWQRPTPVLIASHYDTKFFRDIAFVGANDGASGNGVMLELARVFATQPATAQRVELVFFDGEEATANYTPLDGLHGSRHYSRTLRDRPRPLRPTSGVVLDMVGDRDLKIEIPPNSSDRVRDLAFRAATDAGHRKYFGTSRGEILDDHVPLAAAGVEMTNFIDLNYTPWHTAGDTADQLSAQSLTITGQTATVLVEKYLIR